MPCTHEIHKAMTKEGTVLNAAFSESPGHSLRAQSKGSKLKLQLLREWGLIAPKSLAKLQYLWSIHSSIHALKIVFLKRYVLVFHCGVSLHFLNY